MNIKVNAVALAMVGTTLVLDSLSTYDPRTDNLVNYVEGKHRRKYGEPKVALSNS